MMTTNEKSSIYHYFDSLWSKKKNILLLIVFLLIILNSVSLSAQELRPAGTDGSKVLEKKTFLAEMKASEQSARMTYSNSQHIESLLSKVQPSIYLHSGIAKTYGEKPICLFTDIQSLSSLNNISIPKANIEFVTITLQSQSDLNSTIDLKIFSDFKNLKYVQITSSIQTTEQSITKMILNNEEKYGVFFTIQKGDSE